MTQEFTADQNSAGPETEPSPGELHRILVEWNDTEVPIPPHRNVISLFAQRAQRHPGAVAVSLGDRVRGGRGGTDMATRIHRTPEFHFRIGEWRAAQRGGQALRGTLHQ